MSTEGRGEDLTVMTDAAAEAAEGDAPVAPGTKLGRYVVLELIGSGGMGLVYGAYDPQLDRRIALKIVRPKGEAKANQATHARLLREAQALARLSHPNVVAVYDVGTVGDDDVFIAMEFINGPTLREWIRSAARPWQEVLARMIEAGRGLAAAHHAGLAHRDFKPANVLVARDGRARVVDFGIADREGGAPSSSNLGAQTPIFDFDPDQRLTETGSVMGTPAYMAPEQRHGDAADARSDQFSFCVTLYQALYGEHPFGGAVDMLARSSEGDVQPAPPDTRVPLRVRKLVVRGMAPHRADRWPSMEALLVQLERDPSTTRRRRLQLAGLSILVGAGVAGAMTMGSDSPKLCEHAEEKLAGLWDAPSQRAAQSSMLATDLPYAEDAWDRVSEHLGAYTIEWLEAHAEACRATHVRGEQSADLLDRRMACLGRKLDDLRAVVELLIAADDGIVERTSSIVSGLPRIEVCSDLERLMAEVPLPEDSVLAAEVDAIAADVSRVRATIAAGRWRQARTDAELVVGRASALAYAPIAIEARFQRGIADKTLSHYEAASRELSEVFFNARLQGIDRLAMGAAIQLVHVEGVGRNRYDAAAQWARHAEVEVLRAAPGTEHEALLLDNLATIALEQGHYADARQKYEQALALRQKISGPHSHGEGIVRNNLGMVLFALGEMEDARANYQAALSIFEGSSGPLHPNVAIALGNVASIDIQWGKYELALVETRRALAIVERGRIVKETGTLLNNLGVVSAELDDLEAARHYYERARDVWSETFSPTNPRVATALDNLGTVGLTTGHNEDAIRHFSAAMELRERVVGLGHPDMIDSLTGLGKAFVNLQRLDEAVAPLERAIAIGEATDADIGRVSEARAQLALAIWPQARQRARARALVERARDGFAQAGELWASDRDAAANWLDEHRE